MSSKCLLCRLPFIRRLLDGGDLVYRIRFEHRHTLVPHFIIEAKGGGRGYIWRRASYQNHTTHAAAVQQVAHMMANTGGTLKPGVKF